MVNKIISPSAPLSPINLDGFGLSLGDFNNTGKYHLFADITTAQFIVGAMNRQIGRPSVDFNLVFHDQTIADDEFQEDAYVAKLMRGRRIVQALGDQAIVCNVQDAATRLLMQMDHIATSLVPWAGLSSEQECTFLENPREFWLSTRIHNKLCVDAIDVPQPNTVYTS